MLEEHFGVRMDFTFPQEAGSRLGTGTIVVLDDKSCPVGMLYSLQRFFARESCGWCTPCREGLPWVERILDAMERGQGRPEDMEILQEHTSLIRLGHTFCALAPGAMMPLESALQYFKDDFDQHIHRQRCPWR